MDFQFLKQRKWIYNFQTKRIFKIEALTKPSVKNCVYVIQCTTCKKRYVGETGNSIVTRFYQYKYNINKQRNRHVPVIKHFIHHGWSAIRTTILEENPQSTW